MTGRVERLGSAARRQLADGGAVLPAWQILALLCAGSAAVMVWLGMKLTFFGDDWYFLLQRPGFSARSVLAPHNGHLSALPVLAYKGLTELFGLDFQLPFRIVLAAVVASVAVVVFLFVRERAGQFLALVAAAVLLFLGPAWEDLLFFSSINLMTSLTTGVAALMVLERETPRRNLLACLLLVVSMLSSDLFIPFAVGAATAVLLRRRPDQLWIPAVPAALFAIWWFTYGQEPFYGEPGQTGFALANLPGLPTYVLDSIGRGLGCLTGLNYSISGADPYAFARPLVALAALGFVVWLDRGGRPSRYAYVIAAAALSFWLLTGANYIAGREPAASRYQLIDAVFLILLAAELFRPVRLRFEAQLVVGLLALVVIGSNLGELKGGYNLLRDDSVVAEADLGALEIVGAGVDPMYQLIDEISHTRSVGGVTAGAYFRETSAHGSPADTPAEIARRGPEARQGADNVLAAGYGLALAPSPKAPSGPGCRRRPPSFDGAPQAWLLPEGGVVIHNIGGAWVDVAVTRFAPPELALGIGRLGPHLSAELRIPADSVDRRWHLRTGGGSAIEVCPL